ncbi:hypothetical protein [Streptomyces sp. SPB4]|uniref:hypothetical protein n=1 Tax=Streptomyces sp. SPB4 TaxID=2940553 RepID=UPI002473A051|nr:hypothetical protein [Streptomyces sp. SPB4]MDH6545090.1 hypothetical protein [Streptomyces sp. SPB4]
MVTYKVRWEHDGRSMVSAVHYDKPSAEQRQAELNASGAANVEIFESVLGK